MTINVIPGRKYCAGLAKASTSTDPRCLDQESAAARTRCFDPSTHYLVYDCPIRCPTLEFSCPRRNCTSSRDSAQVLRS